MKLYTKTGDKGQTCLIGGTRVAKNDVRLDAYGTVDELNSFIGLLTTYTIPQIDKQFLQHIQNKLFTVGSQLATDSTKEEQKNFCLLSEVDITNIENEIDRLDDFLPQLSSFILPGGSQVGALCHICRTITRRAERRIFDMNDTFVVDSQIIVFFNRLSDYFFALSRFLTLNAGGEEICWKSKDF